MVGHLVRDKVTCDILQLCVSLFTETIFLPKNSADQHFSGNSVLCFFFCKFNDELLASVDQSILESEKCGFFPTNCLVFMLL